MADYTKDSDEQKKKLKSISDGMKSKEDDGPGVLQKASQAIQKVAGSAADNIQSAADRFFGKDEETAGASTKLNAKDNKKKK